jgi:acyl-CoA reductase-like NAD-dependent aldehyde dehydrogenase
VSFVELKSSYPYYLAGRQVAAEPSLAVTDKYSADVIAHVALADGAAIDHAIAAACDAREPMRKLASYERRAVLAHCAARFEQRGEQLARTLCLEAGKPIRDARVEVSRLVDTFRVASEETVRLGGEVLALDTTPRARGYRGRWKRVPVGVCSFITPFNFPLNLVAHKIAPAIAAGCPFVLKPASATPLGALLVGEILAETSLPEGAFSILPSARDAAEALTQDERIALLSFTGSPDVGWQLKSAAGRKKVVLELGGNAAAVVEPDWDLDDAVSRLVIGAFYQSGQSCISVQRIFVHESIYGALAAKLVAATRALRCGDPKDDATFVGPLVTREAAIRLEHRIAAARRDGARLLCGGGRRGALLEPTLLENVPRDAEINACEAFGPVAVLAPYRDFDEALARVNDSAFGLQAGVFTRDLYKAEHAWDTLEVGGVVIGDSPAWRVDQMPYGGVKASGLGREGVRFAIEEMTEIRLLAVRDPNAGALAPPVGKSTQKIPGQSGHTRQE